jgi:hypothetical protein
MVFILTFWRLVVTLTVPPRDPAMAISSRGVGNVSGSSSSSEDRPAALDATLDYNMREWLADGGRSYRSFCSNSNIGSGNCTVIFCVGIIDDRCTLELSKEILRVYCVIKAIYG